jgi:isopenicillin N synthase-like dioxygenase
VKWSERSPGESSSQSRGVAIGARGNALVEYAATAVAPRPFSFVVNIGELLELATNGYLRATVHRVVVPPPGAERLSVAFFLGAQHDATVPLLTLPAALAAAVIRAYCQHYL